MAARISAELSPGAGLSFDRRDQAPRAPGEVRVGPLHPPGETGALRDIAHLGEGEAGPGLLDPDPHRERRVGGRLRVDVHDRASQEVHGLEPRTALGNRSRRVPVAGAEGELAKDDPELLRVHEALMAEWDAGRQTAAEWEEVEALLAQPAPVS